MFFNSTKIYNVYIKESDIEPLETVEFIEEGFSFYAFIFGIVWGLLNKALLFVILSLIVQIIALFLLYTGKADIINIYIFQITCNLLLAFEANNLRGARLRRKKYKLCDIVVGKDLLEAQQRFFDRYINNSQNNIQNNQLSYNDITNGTKLVNV